MDEIRATLSRYPIKTRLALSGPMIVARDIAHAKLKERIERGEGLPQYIKDHPIYYAGPAKTPEGYASGSFGPTTAAAWILRRPPHAARREPRHARQGQRFPDRRRGVPEAVGFYLGSIGGPAATSPIRTQEVEVRGSRARMEAIWRIEVGTFRPSRRRRQERLLSQL